MLVPRLVYHNRGVIKLWEQFAELALIVIFACVLINAIIGTVFAIVSLVRFVRNKSK